MSMTTPSSLPKRYETYDFIDPSRFAGKLSGKVAIVTGASAGIGRISCLAFAAAGAKVACVARRESELDALVSEITQKHNVPATAIVADVSNPDSAKKIVDQTERDLGPVDFLFNCAGVTRFSTLNAEDDFGTWWRILEVNLRGPVALTHAVLPSMIARKTGVVITATSSAGFLDLPIMSAYGTSKAAVIKFQQSLAQEVERHGILSFSIHPGSVKTELGSVEGAINMKSMQEEPAAQQLFEEFQNIKYQSPDLMANAAVALCADERFKVMNGRLIDCEQPLDKVLEEAEKERGGKVEKENLYRLKLDSL